MSITQLPTERRSNRRTDKIVSAQRIARALRPAEDTIDNSILAGSELLASIIHGRLQTASAATIGHQAILDAVELLTSLADARGHAISCHDHLAAVRDGYNLRAEDVGCTGDKHVTGASTQQVA